MSVAKTSQSSDGQLRPWTKVETCIYLAVIVGTLCAIAGIAIGLRMALHATVISCPNGKFFPAGATDFHCYAHKHAGDGTAIALIAAMLGVVIGLAGAVAKAVLVDADHAVKDAQRAS